MYHCVGDITWFSERACKGKSYKSVKQAMNAHYRYIANSKREDLEMVEGLSWKEWKQLIDFEVSKRWDSRIAGKFFIALPNDLNNDQCIQMLKQLIEGFFNVDKYTIAIHSNKGKIMGENNKHAHILMYARNKDGKKLRVNRSMLAKMHKFWDKILENHGYRVEKRRNSKRYSWVKIKKDLEDVKKERIKLRELKKFKELKELYFRTAAQLRKFIDTALSKGYSLNDIKEFFITERKMSEEKAQNIILAYKARQERKEQKRKEHKKKEAALQRLAEKLRQGKKVKLLKRGGCVRRKKKL